MSSNATTKRPSSSYCSFVFLSTGLDSSFGVSDIRETAPRGNQPLRGLVINFDTAGVSISKLIPQIGDLIGRPMDRGAIAAQDRICVESRNGAGCLSFDGIATERASRFASNNSGSLAIFAAIRRALSL
jgi:hypothetical protein